MQGSLNGVNSRKGGGEEMDRACVLMGFDA